MRHVVGGIGIAAVTFLFASLGFLTITSLFDHTFGGLYRMYMYHEQHPFQYIAVVSITFGVFSIAWLQVCRHMTGWGRWISILVTILLTILVASVPGGILWKIHDMQAGWFPEGEKFWKDILWGAKEGLRFGWLIVLMSTPYNILGLVTGMFFLHRLPFIADRLRADKNGNPNH